MPPFRIRPRAGAVLLLFFLLPANARPQANPPTRLSVQLGAKAARAGDDVPLTIGLRDAYDTPTRAPKPYTITVEVLTRKSDPAVLKSTIVLAGGETSVQTKVRLTLPGVLIIKASHPELREASAFLSVSGRVSRTAPAGRHARLGSAFVVRVAQVFPVRVAQAPSAPAAVAPAGPTLSLRYAHEGTKLTANGRDVDTIEAFLSEPARQPIKIHLWASSGKLKGNPLVIPAGESLGSAELTTTQPGPTIISVQSVVPKKAATVVEGATVTAHFSVPIKELRVVPSPAQTLLGSTSEMKVWCIGLHDEQVAPDEDKEIDLSVDRPGSLSAGPIVIKAGKSSAQAQFTPQMTGTFRFEATTFGASTRLPATLDVVWPVMTLSSLAIGGLFGGLLRAGLTYVGTDKQRKRKALCEICGGPIVGFIGFAACLFGFFENVSLPVVNHPIGAPFIAILAAFVGAQLVGAIAKLCLRLPGQEQVA